MIARLITARLMAMSLSRRSLIPMMKKMLARFIMNLVMPAMRIKTAVLMRVMVTNTT